MEIRRNALLCGALAALVSGCAGSANVAQVTNNAWSAAGQPQYEGVVRLISPGSTADLTLQVYQREPGHPRFACSRDIAGGEHAMILGYGIYPQNPHARFPAVTISVTARDGRPMYAVDTVDSVDTSCHRVVDLKLRSLAAGEEFSDLGALPGSPTPSLAAVVTVDGKAVAVPLRPMCEHGETQSVSGCVYDPLHWNDQPGFPSIKLS